MANSTTLYTLPDGRRAVDVTENKTLAITDQGVVQVVKTDAIVVTLPATVVGYSFTVMNGGVKASSSAAAGTVSDGTVLVALSPNAVDLIAGGQITAADDKDYLNTKATSHVGDEVTVLGNGTTGWNITRQKGVWAREA